MSGGGDAGSAGGAGGDASGAVEAPVVFRKVTKGESRLWQTKRIHHADLNRLLLRSMECTLNPTVPADSIIGAVAYAVTSHGLRVTQRDGGRIVAQRVEAPYLASASSGSWRSGSGQEREEWRMVVASLGVSKDGGGGGGVVERLLSVSFMTDPVFKPTDLAGKGAAAMASLFGSVGSAAATFGASISSGSDAGPGGGGSARAAGKAASGASLSAVEIANARSEQRAESLLQAIVAELGNVEGGVGLAAAATGGPPQGSSSSSPPKKRAAGTGEETADDITGAEEQPARVVTAAAAQQQPEELLTLVPFDDNSNGSSGTGAAAASASGSRLSPEEEGAEEGEAAEEGQSPGHQGGQEAQGLGDGVGTAGAGEMVEVRLCLQFVEGLCARAEEYSRRDASETWKPLEETISRLERDNAMLRQLLEPKYRAVGAPPPPVPAWAGRRSLGDREGSWLGPAAAATGGNGVGSRRVEALLRSTPLLLFVLEGKSVKARVMVKLGGGGGASGAASGDDQPEDGDDSASADAASSSSSAVVRGGHRRHASIVRTAVKTLGEMIGRACEAQEELFLKARLPGAQAYTVELERYRAAIVGGGAIKAVASTAAEGGDGGGGRGNASSVQVDDDLWRLFAARETRLYSSSAALGKKPGRIYVTIDTLWFHSKVLGFESRRVVPLAEVESITLLGTALDLSSSLLLATRSGGVPGEVMLVFPGQKLRQVEPLEVLLRQLVALAVKQRAAAAATASLTAGVETPEGSRGGENAEAAPAPQH